MALGKQKHQLFQDSLRIDREILSSQHLRPPPISFRTKFKKTRISSAKNKMQGHNVKKPLAQSTAAGTSKSVLECKQGDS
jgi:hypothetical protein